MSRFSRRRGLRGRLQLTVVLGIAVVLAALTAGFNLVLARRLDRDATDVARARAAAALGSVRFSHGRLAAPESPDDGAVDSSVWVFAGPKPLERPRPQPRNDPVAASLAGSGGRRRDVARTDTRLYSLPIVDDGRRFGAVVAGVSLEPYEHTQRAALTGSILFALAVLFAVALATRWLISGALRPVARMTGQAAEWSDRDLDRRFGLGEPQDEFTQLAATLDRLLDRVAASLRHEQRFSAELSHELRTPLAGIIAEAQHALRQDRAAAAYREGFERILSSAREMSHTLDALMAAARAELHPRRSTSDAQAAAGAAARACAALADREGVKLEVELPDRPLRVGAAPEVVERILVPVLENGCRYGKSVVRLRARRDTVAVVFAVEDDGPGVAREERERIFEPGSRGRAAAARGAAGTGAGLGLALGRRLARAAGGELEAEPREGEGRFLVRLPLA
jgi:two-component system, OmpR family, sensor kinase